MWSWALEAIGLTGSVLVGRKLWWGWLILLFNCFCWFAFGLVSHQYGFCAFSCIYICIYTHNTVKWYKTKEKL